MIIDAHRPIKLSAPYVSSNPSYEAIDAPPDNGLVIAKEKISLGIFKKSHTGLSIFTKRSLIPDAEKIEIETERAHIVGKSPQAVFMPSVAPALKDEK